MECISTPKFSLALNGGLHGYFHGARGLRQGDPLSLYLFIIGMKFLSRRLNTLKDDSSFKYHPKCSRLKINHLIFADDLLLLCKAEMSSIVKLFTCLQEFGQASGLEANSSKCSVYLSGVNDGLKAQICNYLQFPEGVLPMKYLGLPLTAKRLSYNDYSSLIGKINNQFQSWQKKSACLMLVDLSCSMNWESVCQGKEQGGLGIFSVKFWNYTAATKLLWMVHLKKDLLWIKWVHGNYLQNQNIWTVQPKANDSWMWRQLLKVRVILLNTFGSADIAKNVIAECYTDGKLLLSVVYRALIQPASVVVWAKTVWDDFLHQLETRDHVFFECKYSTEVWNMVMDWLGV
ncbi:uncharacterized protein LOC109821843 [Asparagus officinalis]|uniref:uncharacterized protein LOC109821843 n=1 Tax=Asparagus officinalis TaxID=4686 RepID=UPI00098DE2D5|nr:uncharacterized protein LOC109821843 [Asparagus officinalis]